MEFPSQKQAQKCLLDCHGRITIDSVNLTLKWATPAKQDGNKRQRADHREHFVTQAEAKDSTTLFFHPPKNTKLERDEGSTVEKKAGDDSAEKKEAVEEKTRDKTSDGDNVLVEEKTTVDDSTVKANENTSKPEKADTSDAMKKEEETETTKSNISEAKEEKRVEKATGFAGILQDYVQKVLEDALNDGVENEDERVTAESEPALRVQVRCKEQYGFLEFASNAAATMALAAITKSTDGGLLIEKPDGARKPSPELVGTTLRWAKGTPLPSKKKQGRDEVLEALGLKRQYYPADGRTDCWFCLSSPTCETHLITGVYDEWYATMPKGPVHPGHILLVPVTHTSQGAWTLNQEWVKLVKKVQEHASQTYDMDLFLFERCMETRGGYHTHIQCVPIPRDSSTRLQSTMMAHAKASGFDLRPIQSDLGVKAILEKDDSYFYSEIRTGSHVHRFLYRRGADEENSSSVPLQFAREVLASVLNNPKLAHWKACVVDKEQETKLASDFRASFIEVHGG